MVEARPLKNVEHSQSGDNKPEVASDRVNRNNGNPSDHPPTVSSSGTLPKGQKVIQNYNNQIDPKEEQSPPPCKCWPIHEVSPTLIALPETPRPIVWIRIRFIPTSNQTFVFVWRSWDVRGSGGNIPKAHGRLPRHGKTFSSSGVGQPLGRDSLLTEQRNYCLSRF